MSEDSSIALEHETITHSAEATELLAQRLGAACHGGELLVLTGELGAGKTCFVRGLARGLGADPRAVRSPSFTLLHSYGGRRTLHHYDVYFTRSFEDLTRSGLVEALAAGDVAVLEWGERFARELPADRLELQLDHVDPETRRLRFVAAGARSRELLSAVLDPPVSDRKPGA